MCKIWVMSLLIIVIQPFLCGMQKWVPKKIQDSNQVNDVIKNLRQYKEGFVITQNHRYWYEGEKYNIIQEVWKLKIKDKDILCIDTCCDFPRYNSRIEYRRANFSYAFIEDMANRCNYARIQAIVSYNDWSKHFAPLQNRFHLVKGLPFDGNVIIMEKIMR